MDELENVKGKIKLLDYIQSTGKKIKSLGGGTYGVNPCPICGHNDSFRVYDATNSYNCFSEDKGGDILNYMQDVEGLTFIEAKEKLYKITNTPLAEYKPKENKATTKPRETTPKQTPQEIENINKIVMQEFNKKAHTDELIKYLNNRNISKNAIDKYHLFISEEIDKQTKRLYIPIIENGKAIAYIGRALEVNAKLRYRNSKGTIQPLNLEYLKHKLEAEESNAIYLCEGVFDAISIEEQGKKAISLNSTQNKTKLLEAIKENMSTAKDYLFIIATDNDEAGQKVKSELQTELNKINIRNTYLEIPKEYKVPTIVLSARGEEYDKLTGFDLGIDDYLTKPFSPKELMARIKAILNRTNKKAPDIYTYQTLELNQSSHTLKIDNKAVSITPKEFDLLSYLITNKGIAISREQLLSSVWGYDYYGDDRTVDTHIKMLRNNLDTYRDHIKTVRGLGYKYVEDEE